MLNRIISLEPSITATLIALGLREKLIAVTRYCAQLADVGDLPQVEITWSLDAEQIAALQPDLVIAGTPYRAGKIDELLQRRIPVFCLYPRTLHDVYANIDWLANLCGVPERGEALISEMRGKLASLAAAAVNEPRQRVYVETWPDPLFTAEPWVADIVDALGGDFMPMPSGRQISDAEIIAADPTVIILNWAGVENINLEVVLRRVGWDVITAVRNKRIVVVNEIALNAPGSNLIEGMQELYRAMYPHLNR